MAERIVGIDLGTTNSLVASLEDAGPRVIADPATGSTSVPSVVAFRPDGSTVVGDEARALAGSTAATTIQSVKRFMGLGAEHLSDADRRQYDFAAGKSGEVVRFAIGERAITPPEISALILRELKRRADAALDGEVTRAVITVPAYFNDSQRQATKDAGRLAGLKVLRLVNEPTAAALAYGLDSMSEGAVAVYDLGGGTFDISVLKLERGIFEVKATNGDTRLGGDDIDECVGEWFLSGIDLPADVVARRDVRALVRRAAEDAKCRLSSDDTTEMVLTLDGARHARTLTRAEFEALITPIVERTLGPCRQALQDAGLAPGAVDEVVLVGGSTRIPVVRARVEALFGRAPHCELDPDQVVALGAGIQAGILSGRRKDMLLLDVVPLSLGIETMGGVTTRLIERNTTIPTGVVDTFTTAVDNQTAVDIHVLQGERELAADCRSLARFSIPIEPATAGFPRVEVTFMIDANGILNVTARDVRTGRERSVDVKPSYGLTDEEVERMLEESIDFAEEDVSARLLAEARTEAEGMIRHTERTLREAAHLLEEGEGERIRSGIETVRGLLAGTDYNAIRDEIERLNEASTPLAQRIMSDTIKGSLERKSASDVV